MRVTSAPGDDDPGHFLEGDCHVSRVVLQKSLLIFGGALLNQVALPSALVYPDINI